MGMNDRVLHSRNGGHLPSVRAFAHETKVCVCVCSVLRSSGVWSARWGVGQQKGAGGHLVACSILASTSLSPLFCAASSRLSESVAIPPARGDATLEGGRLRAVRVVLRPLPPVVAAGAHGAVARSIRSAAWTRRSPASSSSVSVDQDGPARAPCVGPALPPSRRQ